MRPGHATRFAATLSRVTSFLVTSLVVLSCGGDRSPSPTCGLALLVGPRLIQQQLTILPFVLTDAPRGLSASLPALVAGTSQQGDVSASYGGEPPVLACHRPRVPARPAASSGEAVL